MTTYVSVSDIQSFLKCRKAWDYSSVNRQNLRHKVSPRMYLTLGTAVHAGLEADANGLNPYQAVADFIETERQNRIAAIEEATGSAPWGMEMEEFDETALLATRLTRQYFRQYSRGDSLSNQGLTYLAAELSFSIPLDFLGFNDTVFVGTFDGIASDANGSIFVVENKTFSQKPDLEQWQYNFQTNGYGVAFKWLTGLPVKGVLYNGIAKSLIEFPKMLKSGKLSVDKRQKVTTASYLAAMQEHNQDPFDPYYFEMLNHLKGRERQGDTRFFLREKFYYEEAQLKTWETEFSAVVEEMYLHAGEDSSYPRIYRTVPYNGCGKTGADCWYQDLCHQSVRGQDISDIVSERYTVKTYGTVDAVQGMEPVLVTSVDDLLVKLRESHV